MAGFNLGAFAGGIGAGVEQGQDIKERYQKIAQEQVARRADQALDAWLTSSTTPPPAPSPVSIPGAQPLPPGAPGASMAPPPGPGGGAPGANMPPPAGAPPPMGAPPPNVPPPPQAAPAPQGAPPPGAGPMPPPQGAPPPAAPPTAPGGGPAPTPPQGAGDPSSPMDQSKAALKAVAKEIAAANPGRKWQPEELFDATEKAIGLMNSLNPEAKLLAQAQIAGAKAQHDYYLQGMRDQTSTDNTDKRVGATERGQDLFHEDRMSGIAERWKAVKLQTSTQAKIAAAKDATTMQAAELRAATQEDINQKIIDFRTQALESGLDEKEWQAQLTAALKEQGMSDTFVSKLFASQVSANPDNAKAPPKRPVGGALPAPPKRGGGQAPPVAGAQKAPDGRWYVHDPKRPGKYMVVNEGAP